MKRDRERENIRVLSHALRWLIDDVKTDDGLRVQGWALRGETAAADSKFLLNGLAFDEVQYPVASPDLEPVFWCEPSAGLARFSCRSTRPRGEVFPAGRARLDFLPLGEHDEVVDRTAWYIGDPTLELSTPSGSNIYRVIGSDSVEKYFLGGATVHGRFDDYLRTRFGKGFEDFGRILDWGCGAARLTRYLPITSSTEVWGADIDAVNLDWCRTNVPGVRFEQIPLEPPTGLPERSFDLIVGVSVFTHLKEKVQRSWLAELERIAAPGAVLLMSVTGPSLMALGRFPEELLVQVATEGYLITGENRQIDAEDSDGHYYVDAVQSRDYIHRVWGRHFEILDIVDALATHQDLVVMRAR